MQIILNEGSNPKKDFRLEQKVSATNQEPEVRGWIQRCIKLISGPSCVGNEHSMSFGPAV